MRLPLHLPNQQSMTIVDGGNDEAIQAALEKNIASAVRKQNDATGIFCIE